MSPAEDKNRSDATASDSAVHGDAALVGLVLSDDFEIRRIIGRGGMGTVCEAWQRSLERPVAIKVLAGHVAASPAAVSRFQREAHAAGKLNHPNIVPIYAQGAQGGLRYYAMELVDGQSLGDMITGESPTSVAGTTTIDPYETLPVDPNAGSAVALPVLGTSNDSSAIALPVPTTGPKLERDYAQIASHLADIADALAYAHSHGVLHRDIKPHNLLFGSDGRLRIADFGLARLSEQPGLTVTGELVGSPLYMSPEQIAAGSSRVDHRSDIYSLGATMFQWLSLSPPYPGETREQVISQIITSEPTPLRSLCPDIPVDLETICAKAMERDPAHRYQDAAEFRDDLRRFVANRPIVARPLGVHVRMTRFFSKHQVGALAMAFLFAMSIVGWALWSSQEQVRHSQEQIRHSQEQVRQAEQKNAMLLDLIGEALPLEGSLIKQGAEAAVPVMEGLMTGSGPFALTGADGSVEVGSPAGVAVQVMDQLARDTGIPSMAEAPLSGEGSVLLRRAIDLMDKDAGIALDLLDDLLTLQPDNEIGLRVRMAMRGQAGRYGDMMADAETLINLHNEDDQAYLWRGLAALLLGQPDKALSDISRAVQLGGSSPLHFALRGLARQSAGHPTEAIEDFNSALVSSPDMMLAVLGRAMAYATSARYEDALRDADQAVELDPDNPAALALRGEYRSAVGRHAEAAKDLERVMELAGRSPTLVLKYLLVLSRQQEVARQEVPEPAEPEVASQPDATEAAGPPADDANAWWFQNWLIPGRQTPKASLLSWACRRLSHEEDSAT